jgi:hypothetical protein
MTVDRISNATRILIAQAIGLKRQIEFYEFWTSRYPVEDGYTVVMYHKKSKGLKPDIIIYKDRVPYMVVEVKNYKTNGYMIAPTLHRAIKRLTQYDCYRLLIVSTEDNLKLRVNKGTKQVPYYYYTTLGHTNKLLNKYNINVMVMDRQDKLTDIELNGILKNEEIEGWIEE